MGRAGLGPAKQKTAGVWEQGATGLTSSSIGGGPVREYKHTRCLRPRRPSHTHRQNGRVAVDGQPRCYSRPLVSCHLISKMAESLRYRGGSLFPSGGSHSEVAEICREFRAANTTLRSFSFTQLPSLGFAGHFFAIVHTLANFARSLHMHVSSL